MDRFSSCSFLEVLVRIPQKGEEKWERTNRLVGKFQGAKEEEKDSEISLS